MEFFQSVSLLTIGFQKCSFLEGGGAIAYFTPHFRNPCTIFRGNCVCKIGELQYYQCAFLLKGSVELRGGQGGNCIPSSPSPPPRFIAPPSSPNGPWKSGGGHGPLQIFIPSAVSVILINIFFTRSQWLALGRWRDYSKTILACKVTAFWRHWHSSRWERRKVSYGPFKYYVGLGDFLKASKNQVKSRFVWWNQDVLLHFSLTFFIEIGLKYEQI